MIPAGGPCPCGSGRTFARCCEPLLRGSRQAASAEELMRSRYCANVCGDFAYLDRTWHPSTRPARTEGAALRWRRLQVLACAGEKGREDRATVEFRAWYLQENLLRVHHEISRFVRTETGCWLYLDGEPCFGPAIDLGRVGRNQPCPCGSSRKFKKCCLALLS
ncbi:MAG TPA: zinc chelation protein SecC [Desulfobulbus sp.]|nr:zinc chelation protein SecC [Desulfobulbus sp.]